MIESSMISGDVRVSYDCDEYKKPVVHLSIDVDYAYDCADVHLYPIQARKLAHVLLDFANRYEYRSLDAERNHD